MGEQAVVAPRELHISVRVARGSVLRRRCLQLAGNMSEVLLLGDVDVFAPRPINLKTPIQTRELLLPAREPLGRHWLCELLGRQCSRFILNCGGALDQRLSRRSEELLQLVAVVELAQDIRCHLLRHPIHFPMAVGKATPLCF